MLEAQGLQARYGQRIVLHDIGFALQPGQTLVVRGANGSGKSTLLRLLCGLQQPAAGTIRYQFGTTITNPYDARPQIGFVAPDLALYRELTARENLHFFAAVRGLIAVEERIETVLSFVGLEQRGNERIAAYSSGMLHRLRYAFALLHTPTVLLLDEPTVMLDSTGIELVERSIEAQRARGITIIATNDPRETRFGDYLLTLSP